MRARLIEISLCCAGRKIQLAFPHALPHEPGTKPIASDGDDARLLPRGERTAALPSHRDPPTGRVSGVQLG